MILNYQYRIYPDSNQIDRLNQWLETCRVSYNYALRELKDWIASRKCPIDAWDFFQKRGYGFPRFKKFGQMKSILFALSVVMVLMFQ